VILFAVGEILIELIEETFVPTQVKVVFIVAILFFF
jgi:hypothetical protein